jgi:hypothetical protein
MKRNNLLLSICFFVSVFSVSAQNNATTTPTTKDNIEQSELLLAEAKIQTSGYSEGWSDGYKEGWCYGKGYGCYPPYPPYPPYPRYGEDTYKGGYNRAFLQALKDRPE